MAAVAVHVFGTPITQGTPTQRAEAAAKSQNADDKLNEVLQASLHSQKAEVGGVNLGFTTVVLLCNATGETMTYQTKHEWHGHVGNFPITIQNGQGVWVIFKHVGTDSKGSVGAVVYNIDNCTDSMIAWNNPPNSQKTAYCEMNEPGHVYQWAEIYKKLMDSGTSYEACLNGFKTKVTIHPSGGGFSVYKAEFSLGYCV
ncbi:hypothetical protein E3N88_08203 [Mikania micrantha]|uniref:Uncharacterized protein n=1 Tax=Mikania micrantha TaxID=192012 RepID=A0A5N6PGK7_9ASTR|nr:hypothetical protein E3N88_08203 [Mikania micrantha]